MVEQVGLAIHQSLLTMEVTGQSGDLSLTITAEQKKRKERKEKKGGNWERHREDKGIRG